MPTQNNNENEKKKQVIGLVGEMHLSMELHNRGWQVHRSYIDEGIDFVITKYYCKKCKRFTQQLIRNEHGDKKCVTNLCVYCKTDNIKLITRYLQVKASEGILPTDKQRSKNLTNARYFSFHPKLRYMMDKKIYYVWIAMFLSSLNNNETLGILHYYIFNTRDIMKFDDINLPTYQQTDNQKTELLINIKGEVLKRGKKHDYSCFSEFHNNFAVLDQVDT